MLTYSRKLFLVVILVCGFAAIGSAQTVCPVGFICLTQAEANAAASNAREVVALRSQVETQKVSLADKDKNYAELEAAKNKNEADLKQALTDTQTKLATATGQLISSDGEKVRLTAIIDFMLKNGRNKCGPLTFICIQ